MYPAVILLAMFGVGVLMLTYILPKITAVFSGMDVKLPATTRAIIATSDFLRDNAILSTIVLFGGLFLLWIFVKTESGKKTISFITIHFPVIKEITIKTNSARFSRIYSSLLRSGVPVIEALRIISETLSNSFYRNAVLESMEDVQKGINLSQSIAQKKKYC